MFGFKEKRRKRRKKVWELPTLTEEEAESMVPFILARYMELGKISCLGKIWFKIKRWYEYK